MNAVSLQIAKHLRDVHFGGNWTVSNLRDNLKDVTWEQATQKVESLNTIATLVFHINYFVNAAKQVLKGEELTANDKFSFDHPPIHSENDWEKMLQVCWSDAEELALLIEQLPDSQLSEIFVHEKYGSYFRNLSGIVEHTHYHLGQIVLVKKLLIKE